MVCAVKKYKEGYTHVYSLLAISLIVLICTIDLVGFVFFFFSLFALLSKEISTEHLSLTRSETQ